MRRLFVLMLTLITVAWADVHGVSTAQLKAMDARVEAAVKAYNTRNARQFFKDFAKTVDKTLTTDEYFQKTYVSPNGLAVFGECKARTINESISSFGPNNGTLAYKAVFAKANGNIVAHFIKEEGDWKFLEITVSY